MNKLFQEALEANHVELAPGPGGQPFVVNGIQYYQSSDSGINMMMKRFHAFSDTLLKHDTLKMDEGAYDTAVKLQNDLLKKSLLSLVAEPELAMDALREAITINERIQQRRNLGTEVSKVYDIATLWYFSENEDPGEIDASANRRKVIEWTEAKNAAEIYGFFLRTPLGRFLPLSRLLEVDTLTSIQSLNRLELLDLSKLSILRQTLGLTPETITTIESRREILYAYDGLLGQLLNLTTTT